MSLSLNSALSGLNNAELRFTAAASNIANASSKRMSLDGQTTAYQPLQAVQSTNAAGGVDTKLTLSSDALQKLSATQDTTSDTDDATGNNTDIASELVKSQIASYDFKANLKTISVQNKMLQNLLDINA